MRLAGLGCLLAAQCIAATSASRVDFGYAFAPPHRMTVGRPGASEKTILDVEPGSLTVSWSYGDLRGIPLAAWMPPRVAWKVRLQPLIDGQPFGQSSWIRGGEFLPMLDNRYSSKTGSVRLEAIGASTGAVIRVTIHNGDSAPHRFAVNCDVLGGWVAHNPAWIEPGVNADSLLAMEHERPDRILLFGTDAHKYPVASPKTLTMEWTLHGGETQTGWIVRPYKAYAAELAKLRTHKWDREFENARHEWSVLLDRAIRVSIPDADVLKAYYAGLGDLFIMREPLADGYVGTICGTEIYRSTNPFEPVLAAIALDQAGLREEAADGLRVHLDMQEPDGNWDDPKGWAHQMWGSAGMKAWGAWEHYRLTGDKAYLQHVYPRLIANSRWQETERAKTRTIQSAQGERPVTYGLMPRGMGDGGLMHGTDYFGVFYPHNFMAVFADRIALDAAEILGMNNNTEELRRIYTAAAGDLRASLERGAITEGGFRWIPGSPNETTGSRWGALWPLFPTMLLPPDDPLITGTIRKIEQSISPGGHPLHTGWMADGIWAAITLDNLAEAHLARDEGDPAIAYLYATLNHGTPLYTWCEERGMEPGTKKTSGDRQHLWTPVAVVRFLRDALVMEQNRSLHLARGTDRSWLAQGKTVAIRSAPTHFGNVSFRIESDVDRGVIHAEIDPPTRSAPTEIVLHVRHPLGSPIRRVTVNGSNWGEFDATRETVRLKPGAAHWNVEAYF